MKCLHFMTECTGVKRHLLLSSYFMHFQKYATNTLNPYHPAGQNTNISPLDGFTVQSELAQTKWSFISIIYHKERYCANQSQKCQCKSQLWRSDQLAMRETCPRWLTYAWGLCMLNTFLTSQGWDMIWPINRDHKSSPLLLLTRTRGVKVLPCNKKVSYVIHYFNTVSVGE